MSQLTLCLFSQPRLERDGQAIELKSRKGWALLAYLAASGPSAARDTLAALLWPEHNQSRARGLIISDFLYTDSFFRFPLLFKKKLIKTFLFNEFSVFKEVGISVSLIIGM